MWTLQIGHCQDPPARIRSSVEEKTDGKRELYPKPSRPRFEKYLESSRCIHDIPGAGTIESPELKLE